MPRVKRRAITARQALDDYDVFEFVGGPPFGFNPLFADDDERRTLYLQNRERLLSRPGNHPAFFCWPFWAYEPGIPAELRELPEPPDYRVLLQDLDAEIMAELHREIHEHPYTRIREARQAWLAEHPPA
jgi:hypothetical protein